MTTKSTKRKNNEITHAGKTVYLTNKELLIAIKESNEQNKMSEKLAKMLMLLVARYATRGNFVNYTYNDDMQSYAMLMLVRTWQSFDAEKSNNPFSFYTQCVHNSFIQYLNKERRHRDIRDMLIVQQGLTPSFNFSESDSDDQHFVEDEQDFEHHKITADNLNKQISSGNNIVRNEIGDLIDVSEDIDDINNVSDNIDNSSNIE